jgi:cell division protein FtsL
MTVERTGLLRTIGDDLSRQRTALGLLLWLLLSSLGLVFVTHHTRLLTMRQAELVNDQYTLESEWRNLILEEKSLSDPDRIEALAKTKLMMQHLQLKQEKFVKRSL